MKLRVTLAVAVTASALALGGCSFLTPNWSALQPTKKPIPTESTTTPSPTPTPTTDAKLAKVAVTILNSSADSTGIDVVAQAMNVSEDGGTCTLTVSQAATKKVVSVSAESNVTDTQCFPIHLPLDGFVSGAATFSVTYKSSTSTGVSPVGQLVIP
jgi:hypothetical protein